MIAALWPSDTTDLDTLLTRIAEIQAGGDTVYCPLGRYGAGYGAADGAERNDWGEYAK